MPRCVDVAAPLQAADDCLVDAGLASAPPMRSGGPARRRSGTQLAGAMTRVVNPKTVTDLATSLVGFTVGLVWLTLGALLLVLVPGTLIARSPEVLCGAVCAAGDVAVLLLWTGRLRVGGRSGVERTLFFGVCAGSAALLSGLLLRVVVSS